MICTVKTTKFYDERAKEFQGSQVAERLRNLVERNPEYEPDRLQCCIDGNYCLRRFGNKQAIFTYDEQVVKGQKVRYYLGLTVMKVGSNDFERFQNRRTTPSERDKLTGRDLVDWDKLWSEYVNNPEPEPVPLPEMSEAERAFVTREKGYVEKIFQYPIFETRQWVEMMGSKDFGDPFKVAQALDKYIFETEVDQTQSEVYGAEIEYGEDQNGKPKKILCWRLKRTDGIFGWFLVALGGEDELNHVRQSLAGILENPTYDGLARASQRAYPYDMLSDKDRWKDMETDKNSNFILSDEEMNLVSAKINFPLFVTGRAGSGKSTMLQYLFADYFLRYLETNIDYPPVYLSYSSALVKNAKSFAATLFEKNHTFVEELKKLGLGYADDVEPRMKDSFKQFGVLVKECIATKNPSVVGDEGRFRRSLHISYHDFRALWMEQFGKLPKAAAEYGPELSWHVIRSYIKGWDSESFCEPSDYADPSFGKKNKSVTDAVFKKIYDRVWSWYQGLQAQYGYWDDQDLVRYCLAPDDDSGESYVTARYSAILCDESQDFTRVETEFIIRLSIYSMRVIGDCMGRLPFVFAGDEFQTLNPTGFSWASLRSYFTERLCLLTRNDRSFSAPEPEMLTRNYRSTVPVVRIANRVQLLRHSRCGDGSKVEPQVPHYAEDQSDPVYCLDAADPRVWEKLNSLHACLILPCADGQTAKEFLDDSPIKGMVEFYEDGSAKHITIYNPVTAKGLEYPIVAVYGFDNADVLPEELRLDRLLRWSETGKREDSDAREIALKYFLSNAYVSVTRAKSRLFILTDKSAKESFWSFALASSDSSFQEKLQNLESRMIGLLKDPDAWRQEKMLGWMVEGSVEDVQSGSEFVNARDAAEATRKQGIDLHDPGILRQAAARFREQSDARGASECEAYAYYYETRREDNNGRRHYQLAGEKFIAAGNMDWAFKSLWRDCNVDLASVQELSNIKSARYPLLSNFVRELLHEHIAIRQAIRSVDDILRLFDRPASDPERELIGQDCVVLKNLLDRMLALIPDLSSEDRDLVGLFLEKLEHLEKRGIVCSKKMCALRAFSVGLYEKAISLWDMVLPANEVDHPREYFVAKVQVAAYPENLGYLKLTGRTDWREEALRLVRQDQISARQSGRDPVVLTGRSRAIAAEAFFGIGTAEEARRVFPYLLATTTSRETAQKLLGEAVCTRGIACHKAAMESVLDIKFDISTSRRIRFHNATDDANKLADVLNKVVEVRSAEFRGKINDAISRQKVFVSTLMNREFASFAYNRWNVLLLTEIGKVMERRGFYVDAARYYEWAKNQTSDVGFKRTADVRWIVCKERQSDRMDGLDAREETDRKRIELGISINEPLPTEIEMDWQPLFRQMLMIPGDPQVMAGSNGRMTNHRQDIAKNDVDKRMVSVAESAKDASQSNLALTSGSAKVSLGNCESAVQVNDNHKEKVTAKFFNYTILPGYKFRYRPGTQLVIACETEDDDWRVKFSKAAFPQNAEASIVNDRLVSPSGIETPFAISFTSDTLVVTVEESGMKISFQLPHATERADLANGG